MGGVWPKSSGGTTFVLCDEQGGTECGDKAGSGGRVGFRGYIFDGSASVVLRRECL